MKLNGNVIRNYDVIIENPLQLWTDKIGVCGKPGGCRNCLEFHKCKIRKGEKQ